MYYIYMIFDDICILHDAWRWDWTSHPTLSVVPLLGDPLTLPPASNRRPCCTGLWLVERDATTKWTTNTYIVVNGDVKHGRCWRAHGIPRRGKPTYFLHIWRQHPSQNLLKGTFTVDTPYLTGKKHMLSGEDVPVSHCIVTFTGDIHIKSPHSIPFQSFLLVKSMVSTCFNMAMRWKPWVSSHTNRHKALHGGHEPRGREARPSGALPWDPWPKMGGWEMPGKATMKYEVSMGISWGFEWIFIWFYG